MRIAAVRRRTRPNAREEDERKVVDKPRAALSRVAALAANCLRVLIP